MWGLDSLGIPYNAADGTITLPWWVAALAAGLVLVFFILALMRSGLQGILVFLVLAGFCSWVVFAWMEHDRLTERRALEARLAGLQAQAAVPGSAFACLDGLGGETIEAACERDVFATPEGAAAAVSYTVARLSLLSDGLNFTARRDPTFDSAMESLRTGLEQDRFGLVAHVLAQRSKCSADNCEDFRLFRDPGRIRSNLRQGAFDGHLVRAAPAWNARPLTRTTGAEAPSPMRGPALPPGYNLPSSDSIPPVSIMNNEPPASAPPGESTQGAAPPPPPRRPAAAPARPRPAAQQQAPAGNAAPQPKPLPPPTRIQ